jgi:iron complex transport system substrate-binding protein
MMYRIILLGAIAAAFAASWLAQGRLHDAGQVEITRDVWQCRSIVSMAPSITETLFALGLGDRVVGVSKFSNYPPEAKEIPRVGGHLDPSLEAILALKPDLVIMLEEQRESLRSLEKLNLETLVVNHQTTTGIIDSFRRIGRVCGRGPEGRRMAGEYEQRLEQIRAKTRDLPRPRVLVVTDRPRGRLTDVYVAADDHYFDTMIELAGGQNAYSQRGVRYPVLSMEGIAWLNPDVIVELVPTAGSGSFDPGAVLKEWDQLKQVEAVKQHRVAIFDHDYDCVPGPRFIRLVEDLVRTIHP